MAEARGRADWSRTASMMALVANVNRSRGQRAFTPADFDPYAEAQPPAKTKDLSILRDVFCPRPQEPEPRR